jgi:hypothetical protein
MIPVTIVIRDLQLFTTIASPRVESAADFKLINPESSQKCCLLYLFTCSTIHISRCGLGGLESPLTGNMLGSVHLWVVRLASATNKQGHFNWRQSHAKKQKPICSFIFSRCRIDRLCQTWKFTLNLIVICCCTDST